MPLTTYVMQSKHVQCATVAGVRSSHGYKQKESKMSSDVLVEPVLVPRTLRFYRKLRTVHEFRKQIQKVLVHQDVGEPPSFVFTSRSFLPPPPNSFGGLL